MKKIFALLVFVLLAGLTARPQAYSGRLANKTEEVRKGDTTGVVPVIGNNTVAIMMYSVDSTLYRWMNTSKKWIALFTSTGGATIPPNLGSAYRIYAPQTPGFRSITNFNGSNDTATTGQLNFKFGLVGAASDADYAAPAGITLIELPTASITANRTLTAPTAANNPGSILVIRNNNGGASFAWNVTTGAGNLRDINGNDISVIPQKVTMTFTSSGSYWVLNEQADPSTTAVLDFPSTSAGTSSDLTVTVTGVAIGDLIILGTDVNAQPANSCYTAFVSGANTVKIRFNNYSSSTQDPGSGTFKVKVIKY